MANKSPLPIMAMLLVVAATLFACQHRDQWQEAFYRSRPNPSTVGK
jgi:hypothetical protein